MLVDWFARQFYGGIADPIELITQEASSVRAGASGLLALPYLAGERSPIFDPHARGVFFGIAETHTRAHFARAVLESVAFALRDMYEVIREIGGEIGEARLAGCVARNPIWGQIVSDILGRRVLIPAVADAGLLGAAILAGYGVELFSTVEDAARRMVKLRSCLEPNPENLERYDGSFELYRNIYTHLKDDFVKGSKLSA
jgi:xylulokinase